jgi:hypothetical protein
MAKRENHYEAAFEEFLRTRKIPYVAVDEAKRAQFADSPVSSSSLKSLDFIVSSSAGKNWLVDVKGRRFPSGRRRQYWKNWSTRDDLVSMARWEKLFGDRFEGLFVFAYNIRGSRAPLPAEQLFERHGRLYGFLAVRLADYACWARPISARWDTLAMPVRRFKQLAEPLESLLAGQPPREPRVLGAGRERTPQCV